jgi:protein TonB
MHASNAYLSGGSKASKIAIVTALHLGVALAFINMKVLPSAPPPFVPEPVHTPKTKTPPLPKIELPDTTTKKLEPPIFIPKQEVLTVEKPPEDTLIAKVLPPGPPPEVIRDVRKGGGTEVAPPAAKPVYVPHAGNCARPDYPARAAREGASGTVNLALLIGADGRVADTKIERSSGSRDLDKAAVAALSMCTFKPATTNGVAEPAWGKLAYVWSLDN